MWVVLRVSREALDPTPSTCKLYGEYADALAEFRRAWAESLKACRRQALGFELTPNGGGYGWTREGRVYLAPASMGGPLA